MTENSSSICNKMCDSHCKKINMMCPLCHRAIARHDLLSIPVKQIPLSLDRNQPDLQENTQFVCGTCSRYSEHDNVTRRELIRKYRVEYDQNGSRPELKSSFETMMVREYERMKERKVQPDQLSLRLPTCYGNCVHCCGPYSTECQSCGNTLYKHELKTIDVSPMTMSLTLGPVIALARTEYVCGSCAGKHERDVALRNEVRKAYREKLKNAEKTCNSDDQKKLHEQYEMELLAEYNRREKWLHVIG
jgi:hypothetical protein